MTHALAQRQIDMYLYYVVYFTAYKTGIMKILELREHAGEQLGERFDIKDFHRAVLLHNRVALPLLERPIEDYIESNRPIVTRPPRRIIGRPAPAPSDVPSQ